MLSPYVAVPATWTAIGWVHSPPLMPLYCRYSKRCMLLLHTAASSYTTQGRLWRLSRSVVPSGRGWQTHLEHLIEARAGPVGPVHRPPPIGSIPHHPVLVLHLPSDATQPDAPTVTAALALGAPSKAMWRAMAIAVKCLAHG